MGKELFFEIGSEEIPAGFIEPALQDIRETIEKLFLSSRIIHGEIKTYGTPRRLIVVADLEEKTEEHAAAVRGPSKKVAYDQAGKPTKALTGFARGQGADLDDIVEEGDYVIARRVEKAEDTRRILPAILTELIPKISFKKSMRWKDLDVTFARPIHWIAALFGDDIIPLSFGGICSSNKSRGHRFHSSAEFEVSSFEGYLAMCRAANVIVDSEERKTIIREGISRAAADAGGKIIEDEGLVEEVANLVEYPVVLRGGFDEEYLKLPREIIINAMKEHQRYFSVEDSSGDLLPSFITVSNTEARDMDVVRRGNERVLRARLSDAAFYYYEDLNIPLDERVKSLKNVVFQAKLGTSLDKVERFKKLAVYLADTLRPEVRNKVSRAAHISKGDLVSGVVCEFPSLQGVMGRDYALKAGEDPEVAEAIFEHYLPRSADDILPSTDTGAIVSMADKMDTICGCFGVGLVPTGASDPYALRRQTLGIINIIIDRGYRLSLTGVIDTALEILKDKLSKGRDKVRDEIQDFFRLRLAGRLVSRGYPHDVVDAVLSRGFDDIVDADEVVKALSHLKDMPDFKPLAVAFKRVVNITRDFGKGSVDPSIFEGSAEKKLHSEYHAIAGDVNDLAASGKYKEALLKASEIRPFVDSFFDDILVMVDEEETRNNRLSLLKEVSGLFTRFADFSKIVTENK